MNKQDSITFIEALEAQQIRQRILKNRVMSLIMTLQISPGGREFISICGFGNERSNADAILYWLTQQTFDCESATTVNFNEIKDRFIRQMIDFVGYSPENL